MKIKMTLLDGRQWIAYIQFFGLDHEIIFMKHAREN